MKLTNRARETIVDLIISDIPRIDYAELARKYLQDKARKNLAELVQNDDTLDKIIPHIKTTYINSPRGLSNVAVTGCYSPDIDDVKYLNNLAEASLKQGGNILEMRNRISGLLGVCTTDSRAKELLPDFTKYIEKVCVPDMLPSNSLPVADIVNELTKLGWPKNAKQN